MQTIPETLMLPTDEFPSLRAALLALGSTHEERLQALGVGSTKYVERIPEPMGRMASR